MFVHPDDPAIRHREHDIGANARIRMLLTKLQHRTAAATGNQMS